MEALIELKFLNSSLSSSSIVFLSSRAFRAYPLIEIRQTVPCRAIRGNNIPVNSTLPPLQCAAPPPPFAGRTTARRLSRLRGGAATAPRPRTPCGFRGSPSRPALSRSPAGLLQGLSPCTMSALVANCCLFKASRGASRTPSKAHPRGLSDAANCSVLRKRESRPRLAPRKPQPSQICTLRALRSRPSACGSPFVPWPRAQSPQD